MDFRSPKAHNRWRHFPDKRVRKSPKWFVNCQKVKLRLPFFAFAAPLKRHEMKSTTQLPVRNYYFIVSHSLVCSLRCLKSWKASFNNVDNVVKGETFPLSFESPANFEQKLFIPFSNPSFFRSEAKSYNHHSSLSLGKEESIKSCNGFKAMGGHGSESKSFLPSRAKTDRGFVIN